MGFFDDLGRRVTDAGQTTMQKAKELSEIARINSLITQEENKVNNTYYQIGKLYVAIHSNDHEEEFEGMVAAIAETEQRIRDYRKQIQDIKGVQRCENCGAEVPQGAAFCSSCGSPMPKQVTQGNEDEYTKCQNCGALVKKGMRFCTSCGKPMVDLETILPVEQKEEESDSVNQATEDICQNCGAVLPEDAVFCTECGKPCK